MTTTFKYSKVDKTDAGPLADYLEWEVRNADGDLLGTTWRTTGHPFGYRWAYSSPWRNAGPIGGGASRADCAKRMQIVKSNRGAGR